LKNRAKSRAHPQNPAIPTPANTPSATPFNGAKNDTPIATAPAATNPVPQHSQGLPPSSNPSARPVSFPHPNKLPPNRKNDASNNTIAFNGLAALRSKIPRAKQHNLLQKRELHQTGGGGGNFKR
jgi:hypothetical protein